MSCSFSPKIHNGYLVKEYENSLFVRVFYHNVAKGDFFKEHEVFHVHKNGKFSVLGSINYKFQIDLKYEFLLEYCEVNKYFHWSQTTNPLDNVSDTSSTFFYRSEDTFKGLAASYDYKRTYIDGLPGPYINNWFYAIGQLEPFNKNHLAGPYKPGPIYDTVDIVSLWMKIPYYDYIKRLPNLFHTCRYQGNQANHNLLNAILIFVLCK